MNKMPTVDDLKHYKSAHSFYMPLKQLVLWCGLIVLLMLIMGSIVAHILSSARYEIVTSNVQDRLEVRASAKTDLVHSWLRGLEQINKTITESDVFRLYASEAVLSFDVDNAEGGNTTLSRSVQAQEPYLKTALGDYVKRYNAVHAGVVSRNGRVLLSSDAHFVLSNENVQAVNMAIARGTKQIAPLYLDNGTILLMYAKPIFTLDEEIDAQPVAALVTFFNVTKDMTHYMSEGPLSLAGERSVLFQKRTGMMEYLDLNRNTPGLFSVKPEQVESLYIGARSYPKKTSYISTLDNKDVFGVASPVAGTPFVLLQEYNKQAALVNYYGYRNSVYLSMVLIVLLVSASLAAILVYVLSTRNRIRVTHQQQMLNALVRAVEIRDPYLSGHHERMARMALRIANNMRLTVPERSTLYYGAMLSSVGKIFIPQKILSKPSELTAKERDVLQQHVHHAEKVLSDIEFDLPVSDVISQMYERMDGTGYPSGLNGSQISLLSRILGICDVYCALTRPRSYREALGVEDALDVIEKENMKFDKGVAAVLKTVVQGGNN